MKYVITALLVLSIFVGMTSAMVGQEQIDKQKYVEGEVIIKYLNDKEYKLEKLPAGMTVEQAIDDYKKKPDIEYVEPNYIVQITNMPNDPYFSYLWNMNNSDVPGIDIKALKAWDITTGSKKVVVAVIDTGVNYNHIELSDNMWRNPGEIPNNNIDDDSNGFVDDIYGVDFYNNDNDPMDDNFHGTHVSGTIGAVGNNNIGITGVNWNVNIMALKFLNRNGTGSTYGAIKSIKYATMMNVDVMSNSWGSSGYSQALNDTIRNATNKGIIFVAAAGNSGRNNDITPFYPSNYDGVISVAAINKYGGLAAFSNYGEKTVHLGAPGVYIYSTNITGYRVLSGTSMATPHVSGVAALLKSKYPNASRQEIENKLLDGTTPLASLYGKTSTGGMLNAYKALTLNETPPNTPPVAYPQKITTTENTSVKITLNGVDAENSPLTFNITQNPINGIVDIISNSVITYTPNTGFVGTDEIGFTANDGELTSEQAIISITVKQPHVPVMCWNGNNTYLTSDQAQARKFALCAAGTYEFNRTVFMKGNEKYSGYSYIDPENNNNWDVFKTDPAKHLVYGVIVNNVVYNTNKDYYTDT